MGALKATKFWEGDSRYDIQATSAKRPSAAYNLTGGVQTGLPDFYRATPTWERGTNIFKSTFGH